MRALPLGTGDALKLQPITEAGSGMVQEKEKVFLAEIIRKLNDLFQADLGDADKLVYVRDVINTKMLESPTLQEQAKSNGKQQFAGSPDLRGELVSAIMSAHDAHETMSTQALNSVAIQRGILDILLNHLGLYEALRERADANRPGGAGKRG